MISLRWIGFTFALALFIVAWPASHRLQLDRSLEKMFSANDPVRKDFEYLEQQFGVSNFLVFAYRDPQLWSADGSGLDRVRKLRESIEALDGVAYAMDLSRVDEIIGTLQAPNAMLNSLLGKKAIHPLLDSDNKTALRFKELFSGQTHSRDTDLVAIGVLLKANDDRTQPMSGLIADLRKLANATSGGMLVGQPVMVDEGFEEIERDGRRLGVYSTISLTALLIVGFRSLRWALITIAVVQWSLVVTRALLVWMAWDLTMVSSMLSSIVMVIGVATTMHWMLGYQRAFAVRGQPSHSKLKTATEAMSQSFSELWRPIFWACVTDAIGFASLLTTQVGPVQDYGSMMALASCVVLVGIFTIVPTLALIGTDSTDRFMLGLFSYRLWQVPGDAVLNRALQSVLSWSVTHRRWIVMFSIALFAFAIFGSLRLKVETDFLKNFHNQSPIAKAYRVVESELGGAGVWDIAVPAPRPLTQEFFDELLSLENELRSIEVMSTPPLRLSSVLSLADTDRATQSSLLSRIPIEARVFGMKQTMGPFFQTLIQENDRQRTIRIMLRSPEQSEADAKQELIARVQSVTRTRVQSDRWQSFLRSKGTNKEAPAEAVVSGYYVLLSKLVSSVVADQWTAFGVATLGILLATSIALGSVRLSLLAILPNALPSMIILGYMGWTGTRVNLGAAMIAAVSMGLSVDSSLHYLTQYQRLIREGKSVDQALSACQRDTGMAVFLATIALMIGFGSLGLSDFLPTVVFGTMAALTMP